MDRTQLLITRCTLDISYTEPINTSELSIKALNARATPLSELIQKCVSDHLTKDWMKCYQETFRHTSSRLEKNCRKPYKIQFPIQMLMYSDQSLGERDLMMGLSSLLHCTNRTVA